jgi:hypothetical protein
LTRRPGERPPPGGHAEERRREFERQRALTEREELDLDEKAPADEREGRPPKEEESDEEA